MAEPDLLETGGVLEVAGRGLPLILLAEEGIGDVEDDAVADDGQGVDFGQGGGEAAGISFQSGMGVVHAAEARGCKNGRRRRLRSG